MVVIEGSVAVLRMPLIVEVLYLLDPIVVQRFDVLFEGDLSFFLYFLEEREVVHLGRGASLPEIALFGHGWFVKSQDPTDLHRILTVAW